ncbi:MAG: 50S ribosomal protein L17 [Candidatus Saccharibacteria bacterium]
MHRHGYQGRKLHREKDQRRALIKGLADSLIKYESIETTLPKAKEVVPYMEKLITKAKKGDLHNRRQIISSLQTIESAHKLVDELAPRMKGRTSGHLRIKVSTTRRGDNAQLAVVSFVDEAKQTGDKSKTEPKVEAEPTPAAKPKVATKTAAKPAAKKKVEAKV